MENRWLGKTRNKETKRILSWLGLQFLLPQYKVKKNKEYFWGGIEST